MHIERASASDVDDLLTVWRRSVEATHRHFMTGEELDELTPAVRDYLGNSQTEFWVLRDGRLAAGFMGLKASKIESLFLSPEYFRQGLGRRFVEHAAEQCSELFVDVNEENAAAIAFYTACGFHAIGRTAVDDQGRPHPLIHMRRSSDSATPRKRHSGDTIQERRASPELRTDILTGRQCIIAPERAARPSAFTPDPPLHRHASNGQPDDPFAEGNEQETPGERFAFRAEDSQPNGPGWSLRVVPNRYPAVTMNDGPNAPSLGNAQDAAPDGHSFFFPTTDAIGEHDVVIECPDSRRRWLDLTLQEMTAVFVAWKTRIGQLVASQQFQSLSVFRNEGFSAGASLAHNHSQMIAHRQMTPMDVVRHQREDEYQAGHRSRSGIGGKTASDDLVSAILAAELESGARIIRETTHFVALCPFASRTAYHVRIVPRDSVTWRFSDVEDQHLAELAEIVRDIVTGWASILGACPSFNMLLPHSRIDRQPAFRWMLELIPRTGRIAGLELLSDLDLVTVSPEAAATQLSSRSLHFPKP